MLITDWLIWQFLQKMSRENCKENSARE